MELFKLRARLGNVINDFDFSNTANTADAYPQGMEDVTGYPVLFTELARGDTRKRIWR